MGKVAMAKRASFKAGVQSVLYFVEAERRNDVSSPPCCYNNGRVQVTVKDLSFIVNGMIRTTITIIIIIYSIPLMDGNSQVSHSGRHG